MSLGFALLFGLLSSALAQTNTTHAGNRFLIALETSRSMERRSEGTLKALQKLLSSGLSGQLRRGDTIGIWTFNDQLHAGRFPLQQWSAESQQEIVSRAMTFLQVQKYEKDGAFQILPALERLIKDSSFLTIILISDGEQKIHGTPFDEPINQAYELWKKEEYNAHMPFITILRAKGGQLTHFSVNPGQWAVEMPPLPQELLAESPKKKPATPPPSKPPPPIGQSLFLSGKKNHGQDKALPSVTNSVPSTSTANPGAEPAPVIPAKPAAPTDANDIATNSFSAPEAAKAAPVSATPFVSAEKSSSSPGVPVRDISTVPTSNTSAIIDYPSVIPQRATKPQSSSSARRLEPTNDTLSPSASSSQTPPLAQQARPAEISIQKSEVPSASNEAPANDMFASTPGVETPSQSFFAQKSLWLAALATVICAGGLVVVTLRRGRSQPVSLITRSLDQKKH